MTITRNQLLKHTYNDSIVLMQFTVELESMPGIEKAAIMMGTPAVLQFLKESSLLIEDIKSISSDDMVIAVIGKTEDEVSNALEKITSKLRNNEMQSNAIDKLPGKMQDENEDGFLWKDIPLDSRIALISVPGQYAAVEAWRALKSNRHVMLFSNNVTIADEITLKKAGEERNLLVMGPDCGTAIINGVPLGFANKIKRGNIGVVAGAGSGLQELTSLIDRMGCGISHAIGTGGRDLKSEVNGITTKTGLALLKEDLKTEVIVILSKPPDQRVAEEVLNSAKKTGKPVVVCMLGMEWDTSNSEHIHFVSTIEGAAKVAVGIAKKTYSRPAGKQHQDNKTNNFVPNRFIRGFFSGGTLAYETYLLLQKEFGDVYSNTPLDPKYKIGIEGLDEARHIILDLGTEEFTTGRAHPMLDGRWRSDLIVRSGKNKQVAIILFDIILGFGADDSPSSLIIDSIRSARKCAEQEKRNLSFIASIIGTEQDLQCYSKQNEILQSAGVQIADSNAQATQMAISRLAEESKY
jgi:FdrA protein